MTSTIGSASQKINIDNDVDFVKLLVNLIVCNDTSLQLNALQLLHTLYTQTSILGENIQKLQLIVTKEEKEILRRYTRSSKELQKLVQSSELWFSLDGDKNSQTKFRELVTAFSKDLHIKESYRVNFPGPTEAETEAIAQAGSRSQSHRGSPAASQSVYSTMVGMSFAPLNQFYKELYRNLGIIDSLVEFLKFSIESGNFSSEELLLEPVKEVFDLLWLLLKNNPENKQLLDSAIVHEVIMPMIRIDKAVKDTHAYFVLRELYTGGNEQLSTDMELTDEVIDDLLEAVKLLSLDDIRKAIYMDTIAQIINQKEVFFKQNQNMVIRKIFASKDKVKNEVRNRLESYDFVLPVDNQSNVEKKTETEGRLSLEEDQLKKLINQFQQDWESNRQLFQLKVDRAADMVLLPSSINYFISFMKVLTLCGDGKNAFSENIGQNFLSMKTLIDILAIKNLHVMIRLALIDFCYHIYLDTEKDLMALSNDDLLKICVRYLKFLVDFGSDFSEQINQVIGCIIFTPSGILRDEDVLNSLVILLATSIDTLINKKHLSVKRIQANFNLDEAITACQNLKKSPSLGNIDKDVERLIALLKISKEKATGSTFGMHSLNPGENVADIKESNADSTPVRRFIQNQKTFNNQIVKEEQPVVSTVKVPKGSQDLDSIFYDKFRQFCKKMVNSKEFELACSWEFENLVTSISALDHANSEEGSDGFARFSASLVSFLDPQNENTSQAVQLMGISIFRKYIESAVKGVNKPSAEWELDTYSLQLHAIKARQQRMIDIGIFKLISKLLKVRTSSEVQMEIILLMISLLIGGNSQGQSAFHAEILEDSDNLILSTIKGMIMSSFEVVKDRIVELNEKDLNFKIFTEKEIDMENLLESDSKFQLNLKLCTYIYRVLQLLCEGHNLTLQNFLRKQSESDISVSSKDINFISETCFLLGPYLKINNRYTKQLGEQILDFLIESVQGPCFENQKKLFDSKIVDLGKDFLLEEYLEMDNSVPMARILKKADMVAIVKKVIKLILSLFEGHDGKEWSAWFSSINFNYLICYLSEELIRHFYVKYNVDVRLLPNVTVEYLTGLIKNPIFDEEIEEAFEIYFFIQTVNDINGVYSSHIRNLKGIKRLAFDFFKTFSNHIEVVFKGGLQKTYFIIQPACTYLPEKKKSTFLDSINRDTPHDKIISMIDNSAECFDIMDHLCTLRNNNLRVSPKMLETVRLISLMLSFLINILIFALYDNKIAHGKSHSEGTFKQVDLIIEILGIIQLVCGVLMILLWGILEAPVIIMNGLRKKFRDYQRLIRSIGDSRIQAESKFLLSLMQKKLAEMTHKERIEIMAAAHKIKGTDSSLTILEYYGHCVVFLLKNGTLNYLIFFILAISFEIVYKLKLLYAVLILDIVVGSS